MKKLFLCMAIALTSACSIYAQDKSDRELSAQYKYEIGIMGSEVKLAKAKLKADKDNPELRKNLEVNQAKLKELKAKKKIVDDAIKSKKASEKAEKKAKKARQKAAEHAAKAEKLKEKK